MVEKREQTLTSLSRGVEISPFSIWRTRKGVHLGIKEPFRATLLAICMAGLDKFLIKLLVASLLCDLTGGICAHELPGYSATSTSIELVQG